MQLTSNFSVGEHACTIDTSNMRIVEFEIGKVSIDATLSETKVWLYPIDEKGNISYSGYREEKCYASRDMLMNQLNSNC